MSKIRLGINIDHVATLRNARGGEHPCPIRAALVAKEAGADGITAHLREDRRHIRDKDMERLKAEVPLPLNFEMAATDEMVAIATHIQPNAVCLVPEKRIELTTEGGLFVSSMKFGLTSIIKQLKTRKIRISLFVDPDMREIEASKAVGAEIVELHTGTYAHKPTEDNLKALQQAAAYAKSIGLEVHAGHGLNYDNVQAVAAIPEVVELNIGHFLMAEAMFVGLKDSITKMRQLVDSAR